MDFARAMIHLLSFQEMFGVDSRHSCFVRETILLFTISLIKKSFD